MDLSHYLKSGKILSCTGSVTHRLSLLPDGNVQVEIGAVTAVVDPATKRVIRPIGYRIPDQVLDHAASLAR